MLHAHAGDENKMSLLKYLHVKLTIDAERIRTWPFSEEFRSPQCPELDGFISPDQFEKHMFTLGSLAKITGIPTVIFDGVPGW